LKERIVILVQNSLESAIPRPKGFQRVGPPPIEEREKGHKVGPNVIKDGKTASSKQSYNHVCQKVLDGTKGKDETGV